MGEVLLFAVVVALTSLAIDLPTWQAVLLSAMGWWVGGRAFQFIHKS